MNYGIEEIKKALINSCIKLKSNEFIPYLLSEKVKTGMPNKVIFYKSFKNLIKSTEKNKKGEISFKIKKIEKNEFEEKYYFNFYDKFYKNAQLTIEVVEKKQEIYFDTIPF
jgi:hypothetical protein